MLEVTHCCDSPLCPTGMKNSIARSTVPEPSAAGTGRKDTTRYSVWWPSCVQYSILSATADSAPLGRLSITVRIGSTVATLAVVSGSVVAAQSNNRFLVGYVLYSLIAVFWVIVPNAGAFWLGKDFPFTTLFFTIHCLGRRLQLVASVIAALLVILLLHLAFYPWPSRP